MCWKSLSARRSLAILALAGMALCGSACAISRRRAVAPSQIRPALEATRDQLLRQYNEQADAVRSLNAAVEISPVAGSAYSGVIEDYHEIRGFVLAQKPARIRVIGQAPVVAKNIFDMVSDGRTFRIFIPTKNKFVVGPAEFEQASGKPIEKLRPQHLLDALFWPELPEPGRVLFEEWDGAPERYYILTLLRGTEAPEIARKVWFDRADLSVARIQIYGAGGRLLSDIRYADWQPLAGLCYPRHIWLRRPHDDYQLELGISKLALNEEIPADRFRLEQPPGTELVRLGERAPEAQP